MRNKPRDYGIEEPYRGPAIGTLVHVRFHLQIRFYTNLFARSIGSG